MNLAYSSSKLINLSFFFSHSKNNLLISKIFGYGFFLSNLAIYNKQIAYSSSLSNEEKISFLT